MIAAGAHAQTVAPQWPPPGQPGVASDLKLTGPMVTFTNDNPRARLQQLNFVKWVDVCLAPCGRTLDPAGVYRVGGGTVLPSPNFTLPRHDGPVLVQAQTGTVVKKWVGFGVGIGGVVAAAYGGLYLLLARSIDNSGDFHDSTGTNVISTFGIALLVTGGVLMAIGFPIFASQRTSVEVR